MAHPLSELSLSQLEHAVELRRQIESLEKELGQLLGGGRNQTHLGRRGRTSTGPGGGRGRKTATLNPARRRKRKFSAAARAALSAAAKARWARAKKAGKSRL